MVIPHIICLPMALHLWTCRFLSLGRPATNRRNCRRLRRRAVHRQATRPTRRIHHSAPQSFPQGLFNCAFVLLRRHALCRRLVGISTHVRAFKNCSKSDGPRRHKRTGQNSRVCPCGSWIYRIVSDRSGAFKCARRRVL
uniref:Secreted RxLR effector protein 91 n=1 Tax=Plasmopara viticola TaxID=143451 RepID=RLR91_PLAVT|nr:RecName: Full=Secreted RxLR effector protein 91; Flags: Precursor [Plasmopara viticola]